MTKRSETHGRFSTRKFAAVPSLKISSHQLPAIERPAHSDGGSSASSSTDERGLVDREEPCFITKTVSYMHECVRMIDAVRSDPERKDDVEQLIKQLRIVGWGNQNLEFDLDHPFNVTHLDPVMHRALDTYAFIAITGSLQTLQGLIDMVEQDNQRREQYFLRYHTKPERSLNFSHPFFTHPKYELVALHPEHLLPNGRLSVFDEQGVFKTYIPGEDRTLREHPAGDRFLSFTHPRQPRSPPADIVPSVGPTSSDSDELDSGFPLNPFLVILNAEVKFRRYKMHPVPPRIALPQDVLQLMQKTIDLVDLLYWELPDPNKYSVATRRSVGQQEAGPSNRKRPRSDDDEDNQELVEPETEFGAGFVSQAKYKTMRSSRRPLWPKGTDFETRRAIGEALLSSHDMAPDSDEEAFIEEVYRREAKE
ncbi:hypothetical protein BDN72DRAFT_475337 [Pluteus cervinus]|uniref:Uncharacterized protein n=1 Tax=Pluteus cervinus TaxID=181527 RepID=A0ACD3B052_9AGAR|nr:hypothetical protein BDN72DRAFT_475337 [Pluteus cervinus]